MKQSVRPTKAMLVALTALALCSIAFAYTASFLAPHSEHRNIFGLTAWALGLLIASFGFGSLLVALYGVPLFVLLSARGAARWPLVLFIGAVPGLIITLLFDWHYGKTIFGFGLVVSGLVRLVLGPGPNNSFKPNPLRSGNDVAG